MKDRSDDTSQHGKSTTDQAGTDRQTDRLIDVNFPHTSRYD